MTNAELLAKIKAEIEKQMKFYDEKEMKAWDDSERGDEDALWYQGHRKMCAKLLSFLSTLESEKPVPNDLEEAAEQHLDTMFGRGKHQPFYKDLFIAGAKWQEEQYEKEQADLFTIVALNAAQRAKEQMMKDGNVILTEEDFEAEKEKSMEWGYNLCKEQMLKDAVEGEVVKDINNKLVVTAKNVNLDGFKFGDKVRVIVLPKQDEK